MEAAAATTGATTGATNGDGGETCNSCSDSFIYFIPPCFEGQVGRCECSDERTENSVAEHGQGEVS